MAFTNSSAARSNNNNRGFNPNNDGASDNWKAQGFLNLYVPNKDGKRTKIGAIPLKDSKPNEKLMLDWLKADPTRVQTILANLEIEFRTSESSPGSVPSFIDD